MPLITLEAGRMDRNQKEQLITEFTRIASDILNIPADAFVVYLKENEPDNIGVGGKPLSKVLESK
ncbi:MAG: 4-oxalocrotonate tautomerase [Peptococcaceae bacterium]|nr:4-oxalocrotonate tautomerase [Peptococcaceae bacterium]